MDECVLPNELVVAIGDIDEAAVRALSACCRELFIEFHAKKMYRCVQQYVHRDKWGNLIHLYTGKNAPHRVIQSIKFIDKTKTIITVWLNKWARKFHREIIDDTCDHKIYKLTSTPFKAATGWESWGNTYEFNEDEDEYTRQLDVVKDHDLATYGADYEQTIWCPKLARNLYTEDIVATWDEYTL